MKAFAFRVKRILRNAMSCFWEIVDGNYFDE